MIKCGDICIINRNKDCDDEFYVGEYVFSQFEKYEQYKFINILYYRDGICFETLNVRSFSEETYIIKKLEKSEALFKEYMSYYQRENYVEQNSSPIMEFKTQEELNECLNWWINKLQLNDWIITAYLCDEMPKLDDGTICEGKHTSDYVKKNSYIDIAKISAIENYMKEESCETNYKHCHELTLVHELMHIKIPMMVGNKEYIENAYYEMKQHELIESMAKILIMIKYNLDFSWFRKE